MPVSSGDEETPLLNTAEPFSVKFGGLLCFNLAPGVCVNSEATWPNSPPVLVGCKDRGGAAAGGEAGDCLFFHASKARSFNVGFFDSCTTGLGTSKSLGIEKGFMVPVF